jgi:hypothetical protein
MPVSLGKGPRLMLSVRFTAARNLPRPHRIGLGTDTEAERQARAPTARRTRRARASMRRKAPSTFMGVYTWSFASIERGLKLVSAAPEPAEMAQAPRSSPRAVGDQREGRVSRQAPGRGDADLDLGVKDRPPGNRTLYCFERPNTPTANPYTTKRPLAVMAVTLQANTPRFGKKRLRFVTAASPFM